MSKKFSISKVLSELGFSPIAAGIATAVVIATGLFMGRLANTPRGAEIAAPGHGYAPVRDVVVIESRPPPTPEPVPDVVDPGELPPFMRYARPVPADANPPFIAIIIDDMGVNMLRTQQILDLPFVMTLAYLSYAPGLQSQITQARERGFEVILHVPMEGRLENYSYGGLYLSTAASVRENLRRLDVKLAGAEGIIGINNHMGSRFTRNTELMTAMMQELGNRGLAFIDSLTTPRTPSARIAANISLPFTQRDVFIDNSANPADIEASLAQIEAIALRRGYVVAIGHPRENTIIALSGWLPTLYERGFTLVPVSRVLRR